LLEHPAYVSGRAFVTSFSSEPDVLSQWRAYADNGAGFGVGFRFAKLDELTLDGNNVPAMHVVRVEYQQDAQLRVARPLVTRLLEELKPCVGRQLGPEHCQILATALGLVFLDFSARCKNKGFSEEAEHRLVIQFRQDPLLPSGGKPAITVPVCQFRSGRYGITPFLKLRFPEGVLTEALSRIVIGPRAVAPDTKQKVRVLLANAEVKCWPTLPIEHAVATYR
jgi:hypothetical protein